MALVALVALVALRATQLLPQNRRDLRPNVVERAARAGRAGGRRVLLLIALVILGVVPGDPERSVLALLLVVAFPEDGKVVSVVKLLALGPRDSRDDDGALALARPDARVAVFHCADNFARAHEHLLAEVVARTRVGGAGNALGVHALGVHAARKRTLGLVAEGAIFVAQSSVFQLQPFAIDARA